MTATAFSVGGVSTLIANPTGLWTPEIDLNEKIWLDFNSKSLSDGPVPSWKDAAGGILATQPIVAKQPVMSSGAGGLVFSAGSKFLNFPVQTRATRHHRSFGLLFKANVSGAANVSGSFFSGNGFAGSTDNRAPYIGYTRAAPNNVRAQWATTNTLNATYGSDTAWHFALSRRVNGVHYLSVDGGTEVTGGTNVLIPRNVTNQPCLIGDFNTTTIDWTCVRILILQNELTDDERDRFQGWAMWHLGVQTSLPGAHPYFAAPPTTLPWSNPCPFITDQEFITVQDTWWKNSPAATHLELNYGNSITSLTGSLPLILSEEFTSITALADEAAAPGGTATFFSPVQDTLLGSAVERSPSQNPTTYTQSGSELVITMQQSNGVKYSGQFCSVNIDGRGFTVDPSVGPIYCEQRFRSSPGNGHSQWAGAWLKNVFEFQNGTTPRIEIDFGEHYGGDPEANHESLHFWGGDRAYGGRWFSHDFNSNYTGFKPGTPWPLGVTNLYDNNYHIFGCYIDRTWLIYTVDGLETCRCPTQANMFQPLYILANMYWNINDPPFVGPYEMGFDYIKVWAGTY